MYQYPPYYVEPQPRKTRPKLQALAVYLGAVLVVAVGVAVYVLLDRLSDEVLTVVATIGCAAGVSLPGLLCPWPIPLG